MLDAKHAEGGRGDASTDRVADAVVLGTCVPVAERDGVLGGVLEVDDDAVGGGVPDDEGVCESDGVALGVMELDGVALGVMESDGVALAVPDGEGVPEGVIEAEGELLGEFDAEGV